MEEAVVKVVEEEAHLTEEEVEGEVAATVQQLAAAEVGN